ncbi:MAG: hypothetical protein FWE65_01430, partial [Eggerthellaceae bacterium]|nr:hypothetical protein [Eggerthellaceae bacterium]
TLGYGSSSFYDAVTRDYIIENTLIEAGIGIDLGTAVLPADKMEYTTYKSDGRTVEKETYSFSGTIELNNVAFEWSAVLRYDYTAVIATGNLADTIRQIYVYVYVPSAATPPELLPPDPIEEEEEEGEEGEEGEGEEGEGEGEGASTEGA